MPPRRVSIPVLENDDYLYHLGVTKDKAKASTFPQPLTHSLALHALPGYEARSARIPLAHPPVGCVDVGDSSLTPHVAIV
jgi:hypothetical protein